MLRFTYYTTNNSPSIRYLMRRAVLGYIVTPRRQHKAEYMRQYPMWVADNDCYNLGGVFDPDVWLAWLERLRPANATCQFAVLPDVLGDAEATLATSMPYVPVLRGMGYVPAFVAQDGLERPPWGEFGVLFIGGTTPYKLSETAWHVIEEARRRGVWVHMGRVNTYRRLRAAVTYGCDSADGSLPTFGPDVNLAKLLRWFGKIEEEPTLVS